MKVPSQVYFLHIPKTAGSSLQEVIASQFPANGRAPISNMQQLAKLVRAGEHDKLAQYPLLMGHFGHTLLQYLPETPRVITFLRDPIARTISRFNHFLSREHGPEGIGQFYRPDITLDEFIELDWPRRLLTNFQTRNLSLDYKLEDTFHDLEGRPIAPSQSRLLSQTESSLPDDVLLKRASTRLDEFAFVGVTDRFEESVAAMCTIFSWETPMQLPKKNKSQPGALTPAAISSSTRKKIEAITELDAELYRHASRLLEARASTLHPQ